MIAPVVTLLTDYGLQDEFVGVCHGVIARICPEGRVIDVTHGIRPQDVLGGAVRHAGALPFLPVAVHVAVVDPGVGGPRRAVAVRSGDGRTLVGPDNGLLWLSIERAGGAIEAIDISESPVRLQPVSATFHGRDIFCPVAAHLAAGRSLHDLGAGFDPDTLVRLEVPRPVIESERVRATVVLVDRFGNLQLSCRAEDMHWQPSTEVGVASERAVYGRAFSDVAPGELILYEDSSGFVALAVNEGSAAERLGLGPGDELEIRPV